MSRITLSPRLVLTSLLAFLAFGCGSGGYGSGGGIVTTITISPTTAAVSVGGTQQFTAVAKDSSGNTVSNPMLAWNSSDTAIATVDSHGLATAVSAGTSSITASSSYLGVTYTSNVATLTVTLSSAVMGTVAVGHPLKGALVTLEDAQGRTAATLSDDNGRYQLSTAGLKAPFLLKAEDGRGRVLFGAAAADGIANLDTVTDLMLRGWYGARGTRPETAFDTHAGAPDAKSLAALEAGFRQFMQDELAAQDLPDDFDLMTTSFLADGSGFDAVLDRMSVSPAAGGLHVEIGGRGTDVRFGHGVLEFSSAVADGQATEVTRLEMP
ncbi:MAG TPA: Ig-like domain-containing protein [Gammaproteobacteria bacterium]|nr:Ig-like domain-containing protein [Gammaproteobacteria bacterium]